MKGRGKQVLAAGCVAALCAVVAGTAAAGEPDGASGPWADFYVDQMQGIRSDGSPVPASRSDPRAALGPAEAGVAEGQFYSLGFHGQITLGFENKICNGPGEQDLDLELVEDTFEPYPAELVDVYVSPDNVAFTKVASDVNKDATLALPSTISVAQHYVKLVDVSDPAAFAGRPPADGYDLDGVRALNTSGCGEKVGIGRMTGGGSLFRTDDTRVTHGFTLRCNDPSSGGNSLEINWGKGERFHVETVSELICTNEDGYDEGNPVAGFDTLSGWGIGRYSGVGGHRVDFRFTDQGEPGTSDTGWIVITAPGGAEAMQVSGNISKGNQQAHTAG